MRIDLDLIEFGMVMEDQGDEAALPPMKIAGLSDIDIGQHVRIDYDKGFAVPEALCISNSAARTQDSLLDPDFQPDPVGAFILEMMQQGAGVVVGVDDDFADTLSFEIIHHPVDDGSVGYGYQGFRDVFGQRPEPGAETRGKDHGLHGMPFSVAFTVI